MQPSICYIPFSFTIKHVIGHTSTVFKRLVPKSAGSSVCWNGCNGVWWVTICNSKLLLTHRLGEAPCLLQVSQHRSLLSSNSPFLSILLTASLVTLQGAHPVKRLSEWERCQRSAVHRRPWRLADHRHSFRTATLSSCSPATSSHCEESSTFLTNQTELKFCKASLWSTRGPLLPNNSSSQNNSWLHPFQKRDSGGASVSWPLISTADKKVLFLQVHISLKVNPFKSLQQQHKSSHVSKSTWCSPEVVVVAQFGDIEKSRWKPDVMHKIVICMKTVNICTFVLR